MTIPPPGDAFATAFPPARCAGVGIEECVRAGAVSGAYACGSPGAHGGDHHGGRARCGRPGAPDRTGRAATTRVTARPVRGPAADGLGPAAAG